MPNESIFEEIQNSGSIEIYFNQLLEAKAKMAKNFCFQKLLDTKKEDIEKFLNENK